MFLKEKTGRDLLEVLKISLGSILLLHLPYFASQKAVCIMGAAFANYGIEAQLNETASLRVFHEIWEVCFSPFHHYV